MADHCRSVLRMVGRIFDDVARVDVRPAHEEDSFTFLNRVATPYWTRCATSSTRRSRRIQ